jgi:hypothetical protein
MAHLDYVIHELLASSANVNDYMHRLIDAHAAAAPHEGWQTMTRIPFESEMEHVCGTWFPDVIRQQPPIDLPIAGLWFGLCQPVRGGETTADFYVSGSPEFHLDSEGDWAAGPPAYFPAQRYANSRVLADVFRISKEQLDNLRAAAGEYVYAEEFLGAGYVAFAAKSALERVDRSLLVRPHDRVGVAVGWDSGDPLYIGWVTADGLQVRDPKDAIAGIERRRAAFKARFPD